ncbi:hypothetical protein [Burkholderia lata]|nr:hypothetical protein [Burkholderia lata]
MLYVVRRACGANRSEMALSGEFIVEEKIAGCKSTAESRDLV